MFPVKEFAFKIFIFILSQIINFSQIFKKSMFNHFYSCLASAISMINGDLFIFDNVIRITQKVPSIRIILSMVVVQFMSYVRSED